jgi:tetratricopeptide (TPR) repeat protein
VKGQRMGAKPKFSLLFLWSASVALSAGCATTGDNAIGEAGVYRDSTTDVVDRAPTSLAVPVEGKGVVIDKMHLRGQADYHFALAETYSLEGNNSRAIEEYKMTLVYDPKALHVRLRLAAEYVKQNLVSEAIEQTKAALEIDPKHEDAHLLLAGLYTTLRMYTDALAEYREVLKNNPDNFEAPMYVGALLAEQKKFSEAAAYFEKLARNQNNPNQHIAWFYLGRVRLEENREKNTGKAEAAFRESISARPSYVESTLALGQLLDASNRRSQTLQLYRSFQEKFGPNASVAEDLARLYIENKEYGRAFEQFAIVEQADPSDINVKAKMAFILIEQQKFQEAILRLEEVLALEPGSDKIRFYLGAVYEEVKDFKSAIGHFQKIPTVSSYYKESVVHTAYLYKLLGDYDKAIATIEAGIKQQEDHPPFYALYASLLDDTKQYAKAIEMLTVAVAKFPDHAQLLFFLGNMQDRLGDKVAVVDSMKKVLKVDGDHVQALNFLAYTYADQGHNLEDAERMVRRAIEIQPQDGYILDTLGWVLVKKGKYNDAVRVLETAYKLQPDESVIAEHLGDAYYYLQMPEKAKKLYQRALEIEKNVAQAEKIRTKVLAVERQSQSWGTAEKARKPASAQAE